MFFFFMHGPGQTGHVLVLKIMQYKGPLSLLDVYTKSSTTQEGKNVLTTNPNQI